MARAIRILHAPTNVGNHPYALSRAERELGYVSEVVDFIPSRRIQYRADVVHDLGGRPPYVHAAVRSAFLVKALRRYDVFHYNWGQPLVPVRVGGHVLTELALVKRLGKIVLVTFQGSDVRPRPDTEAFDRYQAPNAAAMLRHADRAFYLNPDLGAHLPGAHFLPYANVDVRALSPARAPDCDHVVIAHAPTNRAVKGTSHVVAAVDALAAEGLPVRLDLIEGVPHTEALRRLAHADLLVDQLVLGWYGGVAVEAMALGRPVVCRIDQTANPFGQRLPIVDASTADLGDRLRPLVMDRAVRARLGAQSRQFVCAEHDPLRIARRVLDGLLEPP